ncbi:hypothetical protein HDU97_006354 [Phlyctochytrium planicorne]|nr:hypothetical protein HDU97_006354 [Phlyctochytrium planicorne]
MQLTNLLTFTLLVASSLLTAAAPTPQDPNCPNICFTLFDPVCGSDVFTYPNSCNLSVKQCREVYNMAIARPGRC